MGDYMKRKLIVSILSVLLFTMSGCSTEPSNEKNVKANEEKSIIKNEPVVVADDTTEANEVETKSKDESKEVSQSIENEKENQHETSSITQLEEMKAHFIDVGQADATLLQYTDKGEEHLILIDAGNWNSNNVVNYLENLKVSNLDILIGTHPDADHIGQMDKIINNFEVEEVWLSGNTSNSQVFNRLLDAIDYKDVSYHEPRTGEVYDVGPLGIEILNPTKITGDEQNESISLRASYGDTVFLFTGDIEEEGEKELLASGQNLTATIFQMGHHGSKTSNTAAFLDKVNPEVAIISAGRENSYGHPHDEVINRVKSKGIKLYSTHVNGTVIVTTDGKTYNVTTKENGNVTPAAVPTIPPSIPKTTPSDNKPTNNNGKSQGACININTANLEELQKIIHFGPARSEEIIRLRPFSSVDDLTRVNGIANARLNDIKSQGLACVGG